MLPFATDAAVRLPVPGMPDDTNGVTPQTDPAASAHSAEDLLRVTNLSVRYKGVDAVSGAETTVRAVEEVSLVLRRGETLGLVGESGCGKTTLGLSLMRLLPPSGSIVSGEIELQGLRLTTMSESELNRLRWTRVAMVFQGAMGAFNPLQMVWEQIAEPIRVHLGHSRGDARARAKDLLREVDIGDRHLDGYPHEYSGGMLQRAVLAMALACDPQLLIADEPGTALDVVVRAEILRLLRRLQTEHNLTTIVISHDLSAVSLLADSCAVMYAGRVVEQGTTERVLASPDHPYTQALIHSYPDLSQAEHDLESIPGAPPDLSKLPSGCSFHPRCPHAMDVCHQLIPDMKSTSSGHQARCFLLE